MINLDEMFAQSPYVLFEGDCLHTMKELPSNSVDSIVTDSPYGISFMGKKWDYDVPSTEIWQEALRVLKPGGHLLAFAGTRTQHRMAVRIEDAGFEIRDMIAWVYGSGMPKSMDISKQLDKIAGAEREVIGLNNAYHSEGKRSGTGESQHGINDGSYSNPDSAKYITAPATDEAKQWEGWGTALKPALEPITVARKPLIGTVAANVLEYGTGGINIDASRITKQVGDRTEYGIDGDEQSNPANNVYGDYNRQAYNPHQLGRFPANLITDGSPEVVALFPNSNGAGKSLPQVKVTGYGDKNTGTGSSEYFGGDRIPFDAGTGSAARFFKQCKYEEDDYDVIKYCTKASKKDRNSGLDSHKPEAYYVIVDGCDQSIVQQIKELLDLQNL